MKYYNHKENLGPMHNSINSSAPIGNIEAVKLPFSLIDYLIVHELCHLRHPNHSKAYRQELAKYLPQYHQLDDRLTQMKC